VSVIGRNTQGVRLITLENEAEKVVGVSRLPDVKDDEGAGGAPAELAAGTDGATGPETPSVPEASKPEGGEGGEA